MKKNKQSWYQDKHDEALAKQRAKPQPVMDMQAKCDTSQCVICGSKMNFICSYCGDKPKPTEREMFDKSLEIVFSQNNRYRKALEDIVRQYSFVKAIRGEETLKRWINEWAECAKKALETSVKESEG